MKEIKYFNVNLLNDGKEHSINTNMSVEEILGTIDILKFNMLMNSHFVVKTVKDKQEEEIPTILEFIDILHKRFKEDSNIARLKHYVDVYLIDYKDSTYPRFNRINEALYSKINDPSIDLHLRRILWIWNIGKKSIGILEKEIIKSRSLVTYKMDSKPDVIE